MQVLNNIYTLFSEVNPKLLSEILKNISKILPELPVLTRKAVLSQVIAGITVFKKKIELRVGEKIYNLNLKEKASENIKFTEANIERDRRDSNSRPPAWQYEVFSTINKEKYPVNNRWLRQLAANIGCSGVFCL